MAKNKVDACMFCGVTPCECNAKPKRKLQTRVEKLVPIDPGLSDLRPESVSRGSRLARMRADAISAPVLVITQPPVGRRSPRRAIDTAPPDYTRVKAAAALVDEDDVILNAAIRALLSGGLIDAESLGDWPEAARSPTIEEEKLLWKARWRDGQS